MKTIKKLLWFAFLGTFSSVGANAAATEPPPPSVSQSISVRADKATIDSFANAKEAHEKDNSKATISFLVDTHRGTEFLETIVDYGFDAGGFTELDLQWVVDHFAAQSEPKNLFEIVILKNLKNDHKDGLVALLTNPVIEIPDSYFAGFKNRKLSVVANMIEKRYLDAFKQTLAFLPIDTLREKTMASEDSYRGKGDDGYIKTFLASDIYEPTGYTLLSFLTKNGFDSLARTKNRKQYYVDGAQIVMERNLQEVIHAGERDISEEMFKAASLLVKQDDLNEDIYFALARRLELKQE